MKGFTFPFAPFRRFCMWLFDASLPRAGLGRGRSICLVFSFFQVGTCFGQQLSPVLAIIVVINGPAKQRQRATPKRGHARGLPPLARERRRVQLRHFIHPLRVQPFVLYFDITFPFLCVIASSVPICITTTRLFPPAPRHCSYARSLFGSRLVVSSSSHTHLSPHTHSRLTHPRNTFFDFITQLTTLHAS